MCGYIEMDMLLISAIGMYFEYKRIILMSMWFNI